MSIRTARRAAREAFHRHAHIDTGTGIPDHRPEVCPLGKDLDAGRLDAIVAAVAPILRTDGIQEHARRYARRTVQFTVPEILALRQLLDGVLGSALGPFDRSQAARLKAFERALAKLDALDI